MVYSIHGGHNFNVPGASGFLDETTEDRRVTELVCQYLSDLGNTVYNDTDDAAPTQARNLSNICANINSHGNVELSLAIHFNAAQGTAHGVEVWAYDYNTDDVANAICSHIAALGFENRGVKYTHNLYVLNGTRCPAILIECCFCDNETDASIYSAESMAMAIVAGVTGESVTEPGSSESPSETTNEGGTEPMMCCFYRVIDDVDETGDRRNRIYYFDGFKVHQCNHPDECVILNQVYRDNTGRDIPCYEWSVSAPWYNRLIGVTSR